MSIAASASASAATLPRRPTRRAVIDLVVVAAVLICSIWAAHAFTILPPSGSASAERITLGEWLLLGNVAALALAAFAWRRHAERRAARQAELEEGGSRALALAYTDALTGIASDELFDVELREAEETGTSTLLLVELVGFDRVVATTGRGDGSRILAVAAKRLRAANDTCDLVARLHDATFAVLMKGIANPDVARTMGDLMARSLGEPVFVDRQLHRLTAAIGIALIGSGQDEMPALDRARLALAQARDVGRSAVSLCATAPVPAAA